MGFEGLIPSAPLLLAGITLDALFGDPQLRFHPIRLIGGTLSFYEGVLRRLQWDGYIGGCILLASLALTWVIAPSLLMGALYSVSPAAGSAAHAILIYVLFALRDLIDHVRAVASAGRLGDEEGARKSIGLLVGRDTSRMGLDHCRRAAIESLSESFVDGFLSALFWYVVAGIPGLLLFKVASTMDSMVGYKTSRYLRFGWCGARLDDAMNYVPARLAWVILGLAGCFVPGASAGKGWRTGWQQHRILPGPNPGWSEATMAGLLQRRLIGPIWKDGTLVTELWIGDPADPAAGSDEDVSLAIRITVLASALATLIGMLAAWMAWG